MMPSRVRLFAGAASFLILVLVLEWVWPGGASAPGAPLRAPLFSVAHRATLPMRQTAGWAQTVLARPLFSISRRPPRIVASQHAADQVGEVRLSGIMITRSARRAFFAPDGGGKPLVLAEGASVNDSTIRSIQPDRVILASGAILRPSYDHNRPAIPATTPPFQPVMPNFTQPGFANPGFPPNNFGNPGFPPGFNAVQPPAAEGEAVTPSPGLPNPGFRGAMLPPRRE